MVDDMELPTYAWLDEIGCIHTYQHENEIYSCWVAPYGIARIALKQIPKGAREHNVECAEITLRDYLERGL